MKRKVAAMVMSMVMAVSAIGCGSAGETAAGNGNAPSATEDGSKAGDNTENSSGSGAYGSIILGETGSDITTTIKFIHHKTDREQDGTIAGYIAEFNKTYPNITVETEGITDYAEDSLLRLQGGNWGDIMFIPAIDKAELPNYFEPWGTVEEMSNYINFAGEWATGGQNYGISYMGNAQGLLYNKKVFADAGVTELPKTPDEFIEALQKIKDNTNAIPLYTNFAAGWTMGGQWDAFLGAITTGDETWLNQKFVHSAEPFKDNGDGTGAYALYKILYDATAKGLIEDDYTTTDWESCKGRINNGEIGCMVLGSWAIVQMKDAGPNPDDIGYMPFPITVNGKQYATAGADYCYGINKNADDTNKLAAQIFVKWMVEESGWCDFEGGYPISKNAPTSFAFDGVEVVENAAALEGEEDFMGEMNAESDLNFNNGGDSKVQDIVVNAFNGTKTYDEIMADWTKKWNDAQEELEIEVLY
ncbi:MAG: carbohydrate ABC transporter substrate-binding protein [Lachnospiraceae bacterium]|nr:carbohydrate ABC transporter substrate-binding protein [Lachnospiraceae bacterium]